MNFVKANAQILKADTHPYKMVELAGRTCYKSEDKITDVSCYEFVQKMVERKHMAMLEHGTVILYCGGVSPKWFESNFVKMADDNVLVGNLRSFYESLECLSMSGDKQSVEIGQLAYNCLFEAFPEVFGQLEGYSKGSHDNRMSIMSQEDYKRNGHSLHLLRHTVVFTCDRGVSHELVRHRIASFAQESTRFCNYGKNDQINVIVPYEFEGNRDMIELWKQSCETAERTYLELVKKGVQPQWARSVLPNSLKTEVVVTADEEEWKHILDLRLHGTTGNPHPQMKEVMSIAYPLLVEESDGRLSDVLCHL